MKTLTDHLAAIHARIKENAEKKLAAQPELDLGIDDDQAAPEQSHAALSESANAFAQIARWSSDPRVRAEAERMLRRIAG